MQGINISLQLVMFGPCDRKKKQFSRKGKLEIDIYLPTNLKNTVFSFIIY